MGCGDRPVGLGLAGMPDGGAGGGQLSVRARVPLKGGERKGFQKERQGRVAGTWLGGVGRVGAGEPYPFSPQFRPVSQSWGLRPAALDLRQGLSSLCSGGL